MADVMNHVVDQPHVPVDKVGPGPWLVAETPVDQIAVDLVKGHVGSSLTDDANRAVSCGRNKRWFPAATDSVRLTNLTPHTG